MIMWEAAGGLVLVLAALGVSHWAAYRTGKTDGRQALKDEMAERRQLRRMEKHASAYAPRHQAAPWPGPETSQLATTDQLRALEAAAEAGDLAEVRRTNAAFLRVHDWWAWTRRQEREGAA